MLPPVTISSDLDQGVGQGMHPPPLSAPPVPTQQGRYFADFSSFVANKFASSTNDKNVDALAVGQHENKAPNYISAVLNKKMNLSSQAHSHQQQQHKQCAAQSNRAQQQQHYRSRSMTASADLFSALSESALLNRRLSRVSEATTDSGACSLQPSPQTISPVHPSNAAQSTTDPALEQLQHMLVTLYRQSMCNQSSTIPSGPLHQDEVQGFATWLHTFLFVYQAQLSGNAFSLADFNNQMFTMNAVQQDQGIDSVSIHDAVCTWSGQLSTNQQHSMNAPPIYSCKLFIGGVPWDADEESVHRAFARFGQCHIEWPGAHPRCSSNVLRSPTKDTGGYRGKRKSSGYVYVIFENQQSIHEVLAECSTDFGDNADDLYFKLTTQRKHTREIRQVQVIPWLASDSLYSRSQPTPRLEVKKTVFVGALHGMITAPMLATVMNDLFGDVICVQVDTDRYKYPIGSGRVSFSSQRAYFKAVRAAYVDIKTGKFVKRVQIDPFLEDQQCSVCEQTPGPYFCRELICFKYFCLPCWQKRHIQTATLRAHKPLIRNVHRSKSNTTTNTSNSHAGTPVHDQPCSSNMLR